MSQNQGSGEGPGVASSAQPGTHAAVEAAAGYDPHGQEQTHAAYGEERGTASGADLDRRFADPGLPAHVHRSTDVDQRAAKRAERQVAALFGLSVLGTLLFCVGYFAFPLENGENLSASRLTTGLGLGIALFCIGIGAVHWAKKLMPDDEIVEDRHAIASTAEEQAAAGKILREGGEATGFGRRKLIWGSLTGALGALALPAVISLRDLGPLPGDDLAVTEWTEGVRLVTDPVGLPILASDVPVGAVVHVLPEGLAGEAAHVRAEEDPEFHLLDEQAKASVLLMRLHPEELNEDPDRVDWSYNGIVAYSKICTHVGCPVALYEQQTHHLLCPCHQSTFDVAEHCKVIFGPAARPLPQLAITVDSEGYLVATQGFTEPVGPSYWERG